MDLAVILAPQAVAIDSSIRSKKGVLEALANMVSAQDPALQPQEVMASLAARERLGTTGLGRGVAIPHGRLGEASRIIGAFLSVPGRVNFDAIDELPVDLFFALVVPNESTDQHLTALAQLAELFSDPALVAALRASRSQAEVYSQLVAWTSAT